MPSPPEPSPESERQRLIEAVVWYAGCDHDHGGSRAACDSPAIDGPEIGDLTVETGDCMVGHHRLEFKELKPTWTSPTGIRNR